MIRWERQSMNIHKYRWLNFTPLQVVDENMCGVQGAYSFQEICCFCL